MIGIIMLWFATGSVVFGEVFAKVCCSNRRPLHRRVHSVFASGKSAQLPARLASARWKFAGLAAAIPTMVAAGAIPGAVFPLLVAAPIARDVIAWVGALTCLAAALMATQQNDIKRILAYSTISQLGYMVLGAGVAPVPDVPMFHLFTHAFFKCLLFLCAGSVIVALHHEQDIWRMGGLMRKTPVTFGCLVVGTLALAGCPGFSSSSARSDHCLGGG
jgi:NADH-quinone oxidoreductase subunit L